MSFAPGIISYSSSSSSLDIEGIMVEARVFSEFGWDISWDPYNHTMTFNDYVYGITIVMTIGSIDVIVNGKAITCAFAPRDVAGSYHCFPIKFISETFGATFTWTPETKGINVVQDANAMDLQFGSYTALINGKIIALNVTPFFA